MSHISTAPVCKRCADETRGAGVEVLAVRGRRGGGTRPGLAAHDARSPSRRCRPQALLVKAARAPAGRRRCRRQQRRTACRRLVSPVDQVGVECRSGRRDGGRRDDRRRHATTVWLFVVRHRLAQVTSPAPKPQAPVDLMMMMVIVIGGFIERVEIVLRRAIGQPNKCGFGCRARERERESCRSQGGW